VKMIIAVVTLDEGTTKSGASRLFVSR
jgi:hypothetical protein